MPKTSRPVGMMKPPSMNGMALARMATATTTKATPNHACEPDNLESHRAPIDSVSPSSGIKSQLTM
jgi:hypothetical protein